MENLPDASTDDEALLLLKGIACIAPPPCQGRLLGLSLLDVARCTGPSPSLVDEPC